MSSQFLSDPRQESFLQMIHYSVCPLLKRNSFTYYICIIDIFYYILMLTYQQQYTLSPRPYQKVLFNFGQLHPHYTNDFWRLLLSLEQHKNETHLFFSILFKLHFFSFIEYINGYKNTLILYIISGISATLFQIIISKEVGVCGSFYIGVICYAIYLQQQILSKQIYYVGKCSPQQQIQFYFDHHASQDFGVTIIKVSIVLTVMFLISLKFKGILLNGCIMFTIQTMILGQYFTKQPQITKYFYLSVSLLILLIEMIMFWYFKHHTQI